MFDETILADLPPRELPAVLPGVVPGSMEEGFLRTCLERPEDDTSFLVYADWLEEQGRQHEADLIRFQIPGGMLGRGEEVSAQRRELEAAARERWRPYLPADIPGRLDFHRGLPGMWTCESADLFDHGEGFRRAWPLWFSLRLFPSLDGQAVARWMGRIPLLNSLCSLELVPAPTPWPALPGGASLGPAGTRALTGAPSLARLTVLELADNGIGPDGARLLATSPHLARLRWLGLRGNQLGDTGVKALARSTTLSRLVSLDLRMNDIGDEGLSALAASSTLTRLAVLKLEVNSIAVAGVDALAAAANAGRLTTLLLSYNKIGPGGVRALVRSARLAGLTTLALESNAIGDHGAIELASSPHLGRLISLNLRNNGITEVGARALATSVTLERLTKLDLSGNAIGAARRALQQRFPAVRF